MTTRTRTYSEPFVPRVELLVFWAFMGLHLLPLLETTFFPTLDGAAHAYNSVLIRELSSNPDSPLHAYFYLNPEWVPNWTGHGILVLLGSIFPMWLAEKILLLILAAGIPLLSRQLVRQDSHSGVWVAYFAFPFTYSFVFFLGFYNFLFGVFFLLATLLFWRKNSHNLTALNVLRLFLLLSLTYFSHLLSFAILLTFIGISVITPLIAKRKSLRETGLLSGKIALAAAFPLFLMWNYFASRDGGPEAAYLPTKELVEWLYNLQPVMALSVEHEQRYTRKMAYLIVGLILLLGLRILRHFYPNRIQLHWFIDSLIPNWQFKLAQVNYLLFALILLALYFVLPDGTHAAGYVSTRLGLLFFMWLIIWIGTNGISTGVGIPMVLILLYFHINLNSFYRQSNNALAPIAAEIEEMGELVPANAVVLPLNFHPNWLTSHFSNYLGLRHAPVILENYEATTGYFPVNWNYESLLNMTFGTEPCANFECLFWPHQENGQVYQISHLFVLGEFPENPNSCQQLILDQLNSHYTLLKKGKYASLFVQQEKIN